MGDLAYKIRRIVAKPPGQMLMSLRQKLSALGAKSGPAEVAKSIQPHPFDLRYGLDADASASDEIRSGAAADAYNTGYVPSPVSIARQAIGAVPDLDKAAFIDFGCGKGRVLALATEYPFRQVIGLELARSLCERARRNAASVARLHPDRAPIEVFEGDGMAFDLPPGMVVMYLYHPAFTALLRKLARRLVDHQARDPANKVFVIYCNPAAAAAFDDQAGFQRFYAERVAFDADDRANHAHDNDEDSVVIWQTISQTMHPAHAGADRRVRVTGGGAGGGLV